MDKITKYFNAERAESLLFVLVGLIAVFCAIYFFTKINQPFYNGMSYSLVAIALIQITVGASVYFRSPKDIERVNKMVQSEKEKIQNEEIPRMNTVMKNFVLYRWIEIGLLLIGFALFFIFQPETFWKGFGIGLSIQSCFMLLLDFFAESRGKVYLDYLQNFSSNLS